MKWLTKTRGATPRFAGRDRRAFARGAANLSLIAVVLVAALLLTVGVRMHVTGMDRGGTFQKTPLRKSFDAFKVPPDRDLPDSLRGYTWHREMLDEATEVVAGSDAYLKLIGTRPGDATWIDLYASYVGGGATLLEHEPQVCYGAQAWKLPFGIVTSEVDVPARDGRPARTLPVNIYLFSRELSYILVINYYCVNWHYANNRTDVRMMGDQAGGFYLQTRVTLPLSEADLAGWTSQNFKTAIEENPRYRQAVEVLRFAAPLLEDYLPPPVVNRRDAKEWFMNRKKVVVLILIGVVAVATVAVPVWWLLRPTQDPTALLNEADQWMAKKEYEHAVNLLLQATQEGGGTRADVYSRLGDCYSRQRAPDQALALKYYQQARTLAPANVAYQRKLVRALLDAHQYSQAYVEAKKVTQTAEVTAEDYRLLTEALRYNYLMTPREDVKKQYYQEALAAAQKAVDLGPTELSNYRELQSLIRQGTAPDRLAKAEAVLATATHKVAQKDQGPAYLMLADLYMFQAAIDAKKQEREAVLAKAEKTLQEGRKADPENASFPLSLGRLAQMRESAAAAEGFFDEAIKMAPANGNGYLRKATALLARKDVAAARTTLEQALKSGLPADQLDLAQKGVRLELLVLLSDLQIGAGQLDDAGKTVTQAQALFPNRQDIPEIPLERGRIAMLEKRYYNAVNALAEAVDRQVKRSAYYEKQGTTEANLMAREQHVTEARYRMLLAAAYESLGVPGNARTELEKVLLLLPKGEKELTQQANEALMRIYARMGSPEARKLADKAPPNDYLALVIRATDALRDDQFDEAIRLGKQALAASPQQSSAYVLLARAYLASKRPGAAEQAEQVLLDGLAKSKERQDRQPLYVELGRLYAGQPKLAGLVTQIQADKELTDDQKLFLRASLAPDNEQRRAIFEDEIKKDATNPNKIAGLATTLMRLGRTDESLKYYREAYRLAVEKKNDELQRAIWDQVWMILLDGEKFAEARLWIDQLSPTMVDERQAATGLLELSKANTLPPEESQGQRPDQAAALQAGHVDKAIALFKALLEKHKGAVADVRILRPLARSYVLKASLPLQDQAATLTEAEGYYQKVLQELPQDVQSRLGLANIYLIRGQTAQALTQATEILNSDPNNQAALTLKSVTQEAARNYAEAIKTRETIRRDAPQDVSNLVQLGRLYSETPLSNLAAAETAYREALKLSPQSPEVVYSLAVILYGRGPEALAEADGLIEKYVAAKPKDAAALRLAAEYYQRTNRHDEAVRRGQEALALQPDNASSAIFLSALHEEAGQRDEAAAVLDDFIAKNHKAADVSAAKIQLAELLLVRGRTEDLTRAEKLLNEVLAVNPEAPRVQVVLARVFVQKARVLTRGGNETDARQQLTLAEERLNNALARYPNLSEAWLALAEASLVREDRTQAIERLTKILPADGNYLLALRRRADINRAAGNVNQYRLNLQQLLTMRPRNVGARLQLAEFNFNRRHYDEAETILEEGLKYQGDNVALLTSYAQTELTRGKGAEASRAISKATLLDPDNPAVWGVWARIMTVTGKSAAVTEKLRALAAAHDRAEWPRRLAFHLQLVQALNSEKRFDESQADLTALLKEHPDAALYARYADTLLAASAAAHGGRPEPAALEAARKVLQDALDELGQKPELLEELALVNTRAADWPKVEATAAAMLKDDPWNSTAMAYRSDALLNMGKYDAAEEWAIKAVDRDGMQFSAMNNLAWILAEKKKDLAKAQLWSDKALKIAPWHPSLLDTSGWIQYLRGDYRQAIDTLEESAKNGDSGITRYHLGLAYKLKASKTIDAAEKKKALQAARENLQKAVTLGEKDVSAGDYLNQAKEALKNLQHP